MSTFTLRNEGPHILRITLPGEPERDFGPNEELKHHLNPGYTFSMTAKEWGPAQVIEGQTPVVEVAEPESAKAKPKK